MGLHANLIAADLDGINPEQMAGHFRAVASLTAQQIQGMLGWAQQQQDRAVYDLADNLSGGGCGQCNEHGPCRDCQLTVRAANLGPCVVGTICANCAGGDGIECCRRDGGCPCECHLYPSQMEMCEFGTEPFTTDERAALARYNSRTAGTPDCFDCNELAGIPSEFTVPDVTGMFRSFYGLLTEWRSSIRRLHDDLMDLGLNHSVPIHNPHGEAFRIESVSLAARRYLQAEMSAYLAARDGHRTLVIEYFLGHDEHGDRFDYIHQGEESLHDWTNQG